MAPPGAPGRAYHLERQEEEHEADGNVEQEHPWPVGEREYPPAGGRAENRRDQRWPDGVGDRLHQLRLGGGSQNHQATDRDHHGAADALKDTRRGEERQGPAGGTEDGCDCEDKDGGGEDAPLAEAGCRPSAERDEDGEREKVCRDADVDGDRSGVEVARHGGQPGGDDGGVQVLHEEGARRKESDGKRMAAQGGWVAMRRGSGQASTVTGWVRSISTGRRRMGCLCQ